MTKFMDQSNAYNSVWCAALIISTSDWLRIGGKEQANLENYSILVKKLLSREEQVLDEYC